MDNRVLVKDSDLNPPKAGISVRTVASLSPGIGVKPDGLCTNYAQLTRGEGGCRAYGFDHGGISDVEHVQGQVKLEGGLLLVDALNRGIALGAHFIEVYAVDCNDPRNAQVLTEAADKLNKVAQ